VGEKTSVETCAAFDAYKRLKLAHFDWLPVSNRVQFGEGFAGQSFSFIQFDDLETIEHSKLRPVTVTFFVNEKRKILGFGVARIAAKRHLAKLALKKYGLRPNEAPLMRKQLFSQMQSIIDPRAVIESDEHPSYPDLVKKYFPQTEHRTYKSSRSAVAGQGELKKSGLILYLRSITLLQF
jgi:hypothetical protein